MNTKDMARRERRWWKRHMRAAVRAAGNAHTFFELCEQAAPFFDALFRAVRNHEAGQRPN